MLSITGLSKSFHQSRGASEPAPKAVDSLDLDVAEGQFCTLLGPSGCGKTTTLRMIAGLEAPDSGSIAIDNQFVFSRKPLLNVPPNKRPIGMVFQSYAIWPHMTVSGNVYFAMKGKRGRRSSMNRKEMSRRIDESLEIVDLAHVRDRPATKLSGGQQQRLALARALAVEPALLLLDEPLSNLDSKLRERMRLELRRLQKDIGVTTLYVTHDQSEALSMSDVVVVMRQGVVEQVGAAAEVYNRPSSQFVAGFLGRMNLLSAKITSEDGWGRYSVESDLGTTSVAHVGHLIPGDSVTLGIRPEHLWLDPGAAMGGAVIGDVDSASYLGDGLEVRLRVGQSRLVARAPAHRSLKQGDRVWVRASQDLAVLLEES